MKIFKGCVYVYVYILRCRISWIFFFLCFFVFEDSLKLLMLELRVHDRRENKAARREEPRPEASKLQPGRLSLTCAVS